MNNRHILALSGGVGGAKLADGLLHALDDARLTVVVNTGDDFTHLGLHISPDVDTALYTLAGVANPETGWGRRDETWSFMDALARLGGETWFRLGDGDLATHVERTRRLASGETLSAITADFARRLGIRADIVPMSDQALRTRVHTDEGVFDFQDYFVRHQCRPVTRSIEFSLAPDAAPAPAVLTALADDALDAIVICPSNPYLSIAPLLAVPGLRARLQAAGVPIVAVSPLVGGTAVKGPTAKIMAELGVPVCADEIVRYYGNLLDGFVLDVRDAHLQARIALPVHVTDTLMRTPQDRVRVARETLAFASRLTSRR
ncbi:2-phospho-L-lactate transferase [Aromatoleum anaerobium]|uniref:2-phospho-L-lactate transferase n=1 Tax=Aromatoleum anaerobium TaxID=182180 RepID=A0ABX1PQB7_9RHOO|nr:2-phospho-L-lactate transferase [Aromatoleum anaerobium]MCK0508090.1 2-phospho-L-lactate transferase [Aromatoleum anaerobium]